MMFIPERIQYKISIEPEYMVHILNIDSTIPSLYEILENIKGISNVDYNSHFGDYIFMAIDKEKDSTKFQKNIQNKIMKYIDITTEYIDEIENENLPDNIEKKIRDIFK